jgi:hypothetical protein
MLSVSQNYLCFPSSHHRFPLVVRYGAAWFAKHNALGDGQQAAGDFDVGCGGNGVLAASLYYHAGVAVGFYVDAGDGVVKQFFFQLLRSAVHHRVGVGAEVQRE